MLLTRIPHFKEVMVVSFECEHCGARWVVLQQHMMPDCSTSEMQFRVSGCTQTSIHEGICFGVILNIACV